MPITRRTLLLGLEAAAGLGLMSLLPARAFSAEGSDSYASSTGEITVHPIGHASFVLTAPGLVIHNDPVGGKALFDGQPEPDLILISHEHGDHFDPETLAAVTVAKTKIITNPAVLAMLPENLKAQAQALANGESSEVGGAKIEAIPAYNTTADRTQYHPQGRDNGYVLTLDGKRVYIAGDTEGVPEMLALKDIDIAFVPMNLPYTMDEAAAATAVAAFKPAVVYPYHYRGSDLDKFETALKAQAPETKVVRGAWY